MFTSFSRGDATEPRFKYASFWQRLVAVSIDELNLCLISMFILAISLLAMFSAFGAPYYSVPCPVGFCFTPAGVAGVIVSGSLILLFLPWLYTALYESSSWQSTPGKRMLGLVVKEPDGSKCTFMRSTYKLFVQAVSVIVITGVTGVVLGGLDGIFARSFLYDLLPAELRCLYYLVIDPLMKGVVTIALLCLVLFRGKQTLVDKISGRIVVCEDNTHEDHGAIKTPGSVWKSFSCWMRSTITQFTLLLVLCALPLFTGLLFTAGDLWRKLDRVTSGAVLEKTPEPYETRPEPLDSISGFYFIRYLFAEHQNVLYLPESINSVETTLPGFARFYADANGIIGDALYAFGNKSALHFYSHSLAVNPNQVHYANRWTELVQPDSGVHARVSSFESPTATLSPTSESRLAALLPAADSLTAAVKYICVGNRELARQNLMSIRDGDPGYFKAKQLLTYINLENCYYDEVVAGARALYQLDANSSAPYAFAASALSRQGYTRSALPLAMSAVVADPNSSYARAILVDVASCLGLHGVAGEQALTALKLDANEPEAHLQIAHLYRLQSKLLDAKKEVNIAVALKPGSPSVHQERYEIERRLGDFSNLSTDLVYLNDCAYRPRMSREKPYTSSYASSIWKGFSPH
ncbi:MAG: RDD family protein [Candidatus Obscuribacterales bacterium]|nr:RDD family protein [Candidatus Obscuribacterales bacterium]